LSWGGVGVGSISSIYFGKFAKPMEVSVKKVVVP
jgi:hypothetical protein